MCLDWISSSQVLLGRMISANHDQQLQCWKMQMLLLKVREKLTAHPILSSYWCDRRISWQCFTRHLLTPKKETQFQLWTLKTVHYNWTCPKQSQQKTLEKDYGDTESSFTSLPVIWDSRFWHMEHHSIAHVLVNMPYIFH